jgi:hypothetical protein
MSSSLELFLNKFDKNKQKLTFSFWCSNIDFYNNITDEHFLSSLKNKGKWAGSPKASHYDYISNTLIQVFDKFKNTIKERYY